MPTALDPRVLRARVCDHAHRPVPLTDLGVGQLGRGSCLVATGVAHPLLNGAFLSGVSADVDLRRVVAGLGDLPASLLAAPADAGRCAAAAAACGIDHGGEVSLVAATLTPELAADAPSRGVERAVEPEASAVVADALDLDVEAVPAFTDADVWLARDEDGRAAALLAVTVDEDLLGVWGPLTAHGSGHAGRLVHAVLAHYALEGATGAFALAPTPGLLAPLGFEVVETWHRWTKPARVAARATVVAERSALLR